MLGNLVPRAIAIELDIEAGLPPVSISASGLSQAVLNLLINAVDAIVVVDPPVRGRVQLTARRNVGDMSVRFSVSDNGVGMTEKVLLSATDLFFTTKPHGLGTGLGLALVRTIVERAGGQLEIDSRPGEGTTVTLVLPTSTGRAEATCPQRETNPRARVVIEDLRTADLVRQLLAGLGARVDDAASTSDYADADLLVVEPTSAELARSSRWRASHPFGTLVLLGVPPVRAAAAWRALGITMIDKDADIATMRSILRSAVLHP